MSEIKALEKLRECANHESAGFFVNLEQTFGLHRYKCGDSTVKPNGRMILNSIADAIESEIAERFIELPVDANGVPIHVGDELEGGFAVDYVAPHWVFSAGRGAKHDGSCHHVKPRTLEDVLSEFANRVCNSGHQWWLDAADVVPQYADEIRELMKEGGDD